MGITIVQKSDLAVRKRNAKIALVLAGGAITGGAYKLGGLKALDDYLVNRKTTDFDVYVGLSAGAFLAAPLAAGVSPAAMVRSLDGSSDTFSMFRARDFYNLNFAEFVEKPLRFAFDLASYLPGMSIDALAQAPKLANDLAEPALAFTRRPTPTNLLRLTKRAARAVLATRDLPFVLDYLPSGLFDNAPLERFLAANFARSGIPNDFVELHRQRKRELYIVAMNLDTAERVVFGHDESHELTISEAVQASTALPGFYKPAYLHGVDYVDGGVRRTANVDVAIEHGAQLILCYNPFRPIYNRRLVTATKARREAGYVVDGRRLSARGLLPVINQVFRTLLHSRLQYGLRRYQEDPSFRGDIVVIEPPQNDHKFFRANPLAYWERLWAAEHGYTSTSASIERHYERIRPILESYGIQISRTAARRKVERIQESSARHVEPPSDVLREEVPRRDVTVA